MADPEIDVVALTKTYFEVWNSHDEAALRGLHADASSLHDWDATHGPTNAAVAAGVAGIWKAEPTIKCEIIDLYTCGPDLTVVACVEINQSVVCSAMARPSWLGRAVGNEHHHAIEQASRRWRGGRRDDSARTRRKILISTQATTSSARSFRAPFGKSAPSAAPKARTRSDSLADRWSNLDAATESGREARPAAPE